MSHSEPCPFCDMKDPDHVNWIHPERHKMSDPIGNEEEGWVWTGESAGRKRFQEMMTTTGKPYADEVRVKDPETGGEKGTKLARFDLIPVEALTMLAEHYGRGARKYEDRNWEKGYAWSLSYAASQRHMNQFWGGEDYDAETGTPHVIAAAWHMFSLATYLIRGIGKDDRAVRTPRT